MIRWPLARWHGSAHPVYCGLDLSSRLDLTSLGCALAIDGKIHLGGLSWIPRAAIEKRERTNRDRFALWEKEGWLRVMDGEVINYKRIIADLRELAKLIKIAEIAGDPWHLEMFAQALEEEGFKVIEFRQAMRTMNAATKLFESLVYGRTAVHDGNPLLRWALGNVRIETDASGNQKPNKKKSTGKIDPIIAVIMAACRADHAANQGAKRSIYSTQGLTIL